MAQSSEQAPFASEFMGLILTTDSCERTRVKRLSQLSAESRGFSPGAPVSSHNFIFNLWQKLFKGVREKRIVQRHVLHDISIM